MAVNVKTLKIGDVVSEIEHHLNLEENTSSIHLVTSIELFPHGNYHKIGLSGYIGSTETFNEFDVYLPHPAAKVTEYLASLPMYTTDIKLGNGCTTFSGLASDVSTVTNLVFDGSSASCVSGSQLFITDSTQGYGHLAFVNTSESLVAIEWAPEKDITTYELAMCMPWITAGSIEGDDPRRHLPYFRHFKFEDEADDEYDYDE